MPNSSFSNSDPWSRIMSHMYWWLVRAMSRASAGKIFCRKSPNVPLQRAARCSLVKSASDLSSAECRSPVACDCFAGASVITRNLQLLTAKNVPGQRSVLSRFGRLTLPSLNGPLGLLLTGVARFRLTRFPATIGCEPGDGGSVKRRQENAQGNTRPQGRPAGEAALVPRRLLRPLRLGGRRPADPVPALLRGRFGGARAGLGPAAGVLPRRPGRIAGCRCAIRGRDGRPAQRPAHADPREAARVRRPRPGSHVAPQKIPPRRLAALVTDSCRESVTMVSSQQGGEPMKPELMLLVWAVALTLVQMLIAASGAASQVGVMPLFGNREGMPVLTGWAGRAYRAHHNMLENLALFAALVLVAVVAQK